MNLIGPRDVLRESVVISRRDVPGKQGKVFGISMEASILVAYVKDKLDEIHSSLLGKAISFRDSNFVDVNSYNELKDALSQGKWARGPWSARNATQKRQKVFVHVPSEIAAHEIEEIVHLLGDVKDTTISTLATEDAEGLIVT
ncbi:unnamed protein product [Camellia sinensis]